MKRTAWIFDYKTGYLIADGLQSATISDEAIKTAREIARERGYSVIVEDYGTRQLYRVTPRGRKWPAPGWWQEPDWDF